MKHRTIRDMHEIADLLVLHDKEGIETMLALASTIATAQRCEGVPPILDIHKTADRLVPGDGGDVHLAARNLFATLLTVRHFGGNEGEKITRKHAAHLVRKHPTLTHLKGSLRKSGLLE